jgi:hypothetical protein
MEGIIMADTNAISSVISGVPAVRPQHIASHKQIQKKAAPQPKNDTVTISAQGMQAAQKTLAAKK